LAVGLFIGEKLVLTRAGSDFALLLPAPLFSLTILAVPAVLAGAVIAVVGARRGAGAGSYALWCALAYLIGAVGFTPVLFPGKVSIGGWLATAVLVVLYRFTYLFGLVPVGAATVVMARCLRNRQSERSLFQ
jgi:hypothetical protein